MSYQTDNKTLGRAMVNIIFSTVSCQGNNLIQWNSILRNIIYRKHKDVKEQNQFYRI